MLLHDVSIHNMIFSVSFVVFYSDHRYANIFVSSAQDAASGLNILSHYIVLTNHPHTQADRHPFSRQANKIKRRAAGRRAGASSASACMSTVSSACSSDSLSSSKQ